LLAGYDLIDAKPLNQIGSLAVQSTQKERIEEKKGDERAPRRRRRVATNAIVKSLRGKLVFARSLLPTNDNDNNKCHVDFQQKHDQAQDCHKEAIDDHPSPGWRHQ
jgi:hypothetical protein